MGEQRWEQNVSVVIEELDFESYTEVPMPRAPLASSIKTPKPHPILPSLALLPATSSMSC